MPEYCCVRCFSCGAFQSQQVKKDPKFTCVICHNKQTVRKVYAISASGADIRKHVQTLNMLRGTVDDAHAEAALQRAHAPARTADAGLQQQHQQQQQPKASRGWTEYLEQHNSEEETDNQDTLPEDQAFVTTVPAGADNRGLQRHKRARASDLEGISTRPWNGGPRREASRRPPVFEPAGHQHMHPFASKQGLPASGANQVHDHNQNHHQGGTDLASGSRQVQHDQVQKQVAVATGPGIARQLGSSLASSRCAPLGVNNTWQQQGQPRALGPQSAACRQQPAMGRAGAGGANVPGQPPRAATGAARGMRGSNPGVVPPCAGVGKQQRWAAYVEDDQDNFNRCDAAEGGDGFVTSF